MNNSISTQINMVTMLYEYLKQNISVYAADNFINDPLIVNIKDSDQTIQRLIINRWLANELLCFRANNNINITDALVMLINDGYVEDWFTIFNYSMLPFLIQHNVLGPVIK